MNMNIKVYTRPHKTVEHHAGPIKAGPKKTEQDPTRPFKTIQECINITFIITITITMMTIII